MAFIKRRMLAATTGGTPPASTSSKCRRARPSCPFRKKTRASSRRTRINSGRLTRMSRKAAMALSYRSRRASSPSACAACSASAVMPIRNRTSVRLSRSGGGASWAGAAETHRMHASRTTKTGTRREDWGAVIVGSRPLFKGGKWWQEMQPTGRAAKAKRRQRCRTRRRCAGKGQEQRATFSPSVAQAPQTSTSPSGRNLYIGRFRRRHRHRQTFLPEPIYV